MQNPDVKPCITIRENAWWPNTEAETEIAKKLKELGYKDDRRLIQLEDKEILERHHDNDKLKLKAGDRVGSAQFEMFRLNIIPKVFTEPEKICWGRVVRWIDYAERYGTWKDVEDVENEFEGNNERTLVDGIILCLVGMCNNLLRRGLLKAYKTYHETIPMLRGKMAIKEQILLDARLVPKFACEFDELDYDNMENRILLHTLHLCARVTKWNKVKKRIFGLVRQLESLQIKHVKRPMQNELDKMERSYTRLNSHYKKPHLVCRQIIDAMAIADFYSGDAEYTVPIFVSMPRTFEGFVERLFEDYTGKEINVEPQKGEPAWTSLDGKEKLKTQRPDIVLREDNKPPKIVDMKYKKVLDADDLYQLGFYMHELSEENIDHSFAIMPKYKGEAAGGPYKSWKTEVKVYEKRINLDDFSKIIYGSLDRGKKDEKLKEMVKKLTVTTS